MVEQKQLEKNTKFKPLKTHSHDNFNRTSEITSGGWAIDKQFKPQPQYNAPMEPMTMSSTQPQDDNTGWILSANTNN